jgi:Ca2+-binding EF-hand superfamily protein
MTKVNPTQMRELFTKHDRDRDGRITFEELGNIMSEIGDPVSPEELTELASKTDQDRSGRIELDEFLLMINCRRTGVSEADIVAAFRVFDRDGDGKLTPLEFERIMRNLADPVTQEEVQDLLQQAGAAGGLIDYAKFIHSVLSG